jgi:hypothetical protein
MTGKIPLPRAPPMTNGFAQADSAMTMTGKTHTSAGGGSRRYVGSVIFPVHKEDSEQAIEINKFAAEVLTYASQTRQNIYLWKLRLLSYLQHSGWSSAVF